MKNKRRSFLQMLLFGLLISHFQPRCPRCDMPTMHPPMFGYWGYHGYDD